MFAIIACIKQGMAIEIPAPKALKRPKTLQIHGDNREDPYFWMRDRDAPEVIDYLNSENAYYEAQMVHTKKLQEKLFSEYRSRIKEDDESVPFLKNGYWYQTLERAGLEYPIYTRRKDGQDEAEVLFDVNEMAQGHDYFSLTYAISSDNRKAAYGVDTVSRRIYTIRFKDLETGELLSDLLEHTTGRAVWASDHRTVFYTRINPETLRPYQIYRHVLGTSTDQDELVYEENDETFRTYVYKTKSREFIIIGSESTVSSEYRFIRSDRQMDEFRLIAPRVRDLEYDVFHYGSHFYFLTNKDGATDFKLMRTGLERTSVEDWEEVIPHRPGVLLEDVEIFTDHLALCERSKGLGRIRVLSWDGSSDYYLPVDSETYVIGFGINPNFDSMRVRYYFNTMTAPGSIWEWDMQDRKPILLKQQEIPDPGFDPNNYQSERIWAKAEDGKQIPISVISRKEFRKGMGAPLLLYGYGSYGYTVDPYFSTNRLSLLDRGFAFAIAHVRGGQYLGRQWYEDGKMLKKKNTFTDFISCARHLVGQGYTTPDHLYAKGGSAGGLLMGAVMNMAPDLFHGIVANVPFVDVVTTMLDETIPLTTGEYDEWGNPNDPEYYHYIKSYSPYDNVERIDYPHLLVTTGYHDSQVQYWEPAKWIARLRERNTGNGKLLFHIQMETGHSGSSGRFEALRDIARDQAFLLELEGILE